MPRPSKARAKEARDAASLLVAEEGESAEVAKEPRRASKKKKPPSRGAAKISPGTASAPRHRVEVRKNRGRAPVHEASDDDYDDDADERWEGMQRLPCPPRLLIAAGVIVFVAAAGAKLVVSGSRLKGKYASQIPRGILTPDRAQ